MTHPVLLVQEKNMYIITDVYIIDRDS